MKHILYLDKNPLLNTYGLLADLLAVISKIDKKGVWLASNYNNIIGFRPDAPFALYELSILQNRECGLNMFYQCPFLDFYKYSRSRIQSEEIVNFIREHIMEGYYILLHVDRSWIPFYDIHIKSQHEIMIYGFDDDKKEFLLCDNDAIGKYRMDIACTYCELLQGYGNYIVENEKQDLHNSIVVIKPTKDRYGYFFSKEIFIAQIKEYLNLSPFFGGRESKGYWVYGMENYQYFIQYLKKLIKGYGADIRKDIRGFCALHDHKKSLCFTFEYLCKEGIADKKFFYKYYQIEREVFLMRNMLLKIYLQYSEKTAQSLLERMKKVMVKEREILSEFLAEG